MPTQMKLPSYEESAPFTYKKIEGIHWRMYLATSLAALTGAGLGCSLAQKPKIEQPASHTVPYYFTGEASRFSEIFGYVTFKDNLAPGMKAFAEYEGRKVELKSSWYQEDLAVFDLPIELRDKKEFQVYAVDRDGNQSQPKKLYTLEGVLLENEPR